MALINDRLQEMVGHTARKVWLTQDLQRQLLELRNNELSTVLVEQRDHVQRHLEQARKLDADLDALELQLLPLVVSHEGQANLKTYGEQVERYRTVRNQVIRLVE